MKKISLAIVALCFVASVGYCQEQVKENWKLADEKYFEIKIPFDAEKVAVRGEDSYVGQYRNDSIEISFDYGMFSNPLEHFEEQLNFQERNENIDGREAKIVEYSKSGVNLVAVHFSNGGRLARGGNKLTVECSCKSDDACEIARKVIRSIKFKN